MEPFEVVGYYGAPLPLLLHGDASRCAVVLPGSGAAGNRLGGTPARPDLHFTRALLQEHGLAVLEVWWDAGAAQRDAFEAWLLENARAALDAVRDRGRESVLLVGRSIGTVALSLVRSSEPELARLPSIWVAPLLHREDVRESLLHGGGERFVLCGSADEAYDRDAATLLHRRGADVVVLEGADHGLDCGDAVASARALGEALERMRHFLERCASIK